MRKHAFLIMAYDDLELLKMLIKQIDHKRNDIYIHLDKKSRIRDEELHNITVYSSVYFTDRVSVTWGGESLIEAELLLLKKSTKKYKYDYYHLLSGHDFIIVPQDSLHNFFDNNYGKEFVDCRQTDIEPFLFRVKYFFLFQDWFSGKSKFNKLANRVSAFIQKVFCVDRLRNGYGKYSFGSQWFSITDQLAKYVVEQELKIKENFYKGLCADELFLQTVLLNAPFFKKSLLYKAPLDNSTSLEANCRNALRAIDFNRGKDGSPYTFDENDYALLKNSNCIFARKLSSTKSMKLIRMISKEL